MADDEKSHMSELTEDRTQKHMEEFSSSNTNRSRLPPTYIDATPQQPQRLETISSSTPRRLSVAQRARLEADRGSSVHSIPRVPTSALQRSPSGSSLLGSMAKSLSDAIDNSVLGLPDPDFHNDDDDDDDLGDSLHSTNNNDEEEDENERPKSEVTTGTGSSVMSLAERQQMQRAKQIAFLKQQGLLTKKEASTRSPSPSSSASTSRNR